MDSTAKNPLGNPLEMGQGLHARKSFARNIFKLEMWSPVSGFFPIETIN